MVTQTSEALPLSVLRATSASTKAEQLGASLLPTFRPAAADAAPFQITFRKKAVVKAIAFF